MARSLRGAAPAAEEPGADGLERKNGDRGKTFFDKFRPWEGDTHALPVAILRDSSRVEEETSRFFFHGNELIQVYRTKEGQKSQRLYGMFKPPVPRSPDDYKTIERRRRIIEFRNEMKKRGIPGA